MREPHPILVELRDRRREAGLSQRAVAERVHYCPQTVTLWESGTNEPCLDAIAAYAEVLGCWLVLGGFRGPIAGLLRGHRLDAGLTQADIAIKLDTTIITVCRWETGQRRISLRTATAYAAVFGLELGLVVADAH